MMSFCRTAMLNDRFITEAERAVAQELVEYNAPLEVLFRKFSQKDEQIPSTPGYSSTNKSPSHPSSTRQLFLRLKMSKTGTPG